MVPCYNEEDALPETAHTLFSLLKSMVEDGAVSPESYICFVNDGSSDRTWQVVESLMGQSRAFRGVNLSRNFGHQGALLAGLFTADADAYVSIDADLQDDEQKIREMVKLYREGKDIVYGCRDNRDTDTWFKRTTAQLFYKLREWAGCYTIPNHADYRLMSRRAVDALKQFREVNLFIRGIIPLLGFPSAKVYYARKAREQGESKYPLRKMVALAWNGVVNFSEAPLMLCVIVGLLGIMICVALAAWTVWRWYIGATIPGWASLLLVISVFSSLQFLFLGIIGLYIGKMMRETKHRPVFIVQNDCTRR
ncbi:MAG: glycosyltransferase family 2 protein [Akkermansia sp.]|nr:glycosyltransferase family 2 protein [Akkermansia sp.]